MKKFYGFVLILSESDDKLLASIITNLQKKYCDKPPFQPHLTINVGKEMLLNKAIMTVDKYYEGLKKFTVDTNGLGYEKRWSKTLYIKIKLSENLEKMYLGFSKALGFKKPAPYLPHISLMYQEGFPEKTKKEIIKDIRVPNKLQITGIQIASTSDTTGSWSDYTKWKVEYQKYFV